MPKQRKQPKYDVSGLPADVLQRIAILLPFRERFKLPIVCKSWAVALDHAPALWQAVLVDSRQQARTSRRRPLKKPSHFPTAASVLAWFLRHGSQVQQLTLANIDETALQATPEGCVGAGGIARALAMAAPSLRTLAFVDCCLPALLGPPLDALAALPQLRALTLSLPDLEHAWTAAAFCCLTRLAGLEELALTAAPPHRQWLPSGLSALTRLTSLSVATPSVRSELVLPRGLGALAPTLRHLSIENHILLSPHEEVAHAHMVSAEQLCAFTRLTSLRLVGCELGLQAYAGGLRGGACRLPRGISCLAGLQRLELGRHKLSEGELEAVARLTGLRTLLLAAEHRRVPHAVPAALGALEGLRHLALAHGLAQVPPAIIGMTRLTQLDLSFNRLHTLRPGPYLKQLEIVKLGCNEYRSWPKQLGAARETLREAHLHQNEGLELTDRDVAQLLTFRRLHQLVLFGASDSRATQRCLIQLAKVLQVDF